jgi:FAD/FMN-containing dehydrogenase
MTGGPTEVAAILRQVLGDVGVLTGSDAAVRTVGGAEPVPLGADVVARPASTSEVSRVLAVCSELGVPVVPLGGGTGLVGGATAHGAVALSLERMRTIHEVDPADRVLVADAGVVLEAAQEAAAGAGLDLGLDLGARGSAQLGGLVATNAGGNGVIRHGMTRQRILGLEVVLADGTVVDGIRRMVKDNTGYDLASLFVGSEGTLGVVTRVAWRCSPRAPAKATALVSVPTFDAVVALLAALQTATAGTVSAYEVMWRSFYDLVAVESGRHRPPLPADSPFYVLTEVEFGSSSDAGERFAEVVRAMVDAGHVTDAVVAHTAADREALWAIRDDIPALVGALGIRLAYDISMPIATMEGYLSDLGEALEERFPGSRLVVFGHLGDGNLHVTIGGPDEHADEVDELVYAPLAALGGSISAEHGIGRVKRAHLRRSRSDPEIAVMRSIKQALDPHGILNPGVLFD